MTPGTRPFPEQSEFRQSVLARIPVVRFLCHPDSGFITGEVLMVDGGCTLA